MTIAHKGHTRGDHTTDSWVTPKWVIDRLGPFDLDPCACDPQPWPTARKMITINEDGLLYLWHGFVWLNPPYGKSLGIWLNQLALHNNGIALVFARTETRAFQRFVWPFASTILFLYGRLTFYLPNGSPAKHNSGGPSVFIGYGSEAKKRLQQCQDLGACVRINRSPTIRL